jgi:hypothetical protein
VQLSASLSKAPYDLLVFYIYFRQDINP